MFRMSEGRNIDALLQRSEELTATLYGGDELPRVKRNLTQVLDAGKRLWSKTAAHGTEAHQVKAALLLGTLRTYLLLEFSIISFLKNYYKNDF